MKKILCVIVSIFFLNISAQKKRSMKETLQPYHFPTQFLKLEEGEVAYMKEGQGKKTLVFVHGLSSNADAWSRNIEDLKDDFTCIAIDLPGYGKSYKNAGDFTATYFSEIISKVTDQLKLKNFTLVGHSMGGQAAIKFAAKYPEKLEKLVLIAPAGIEKFTDFEGNAMKMVMKQKTIMATTPEQIERNYNLNFFKMPKEAEKMILDRKNIVNAADFDLHALAIEKSVSGMLDDTVTSELSQIRTPVLFLFAKNDMLIPNKYLHPLMTIDHVAEEAENHVKNSKLIMIDEAGHFLQFEKPAVVNKEIKAFVNCK